MLNIDVFRSEIGQLSVNNRYRVQFLKSNKYFTGSLIQNYYMYARDVQIPNQSVKPRNFAFWGKNRTLAGGLDFDVLPITFISDKEMGLHSGFEKWMDNIYDKDGSYLHYYDDYIDHMYIYIYNRQGTIIKKIEVMEAWPRDLSSVELSYDNENQIMTFNVNFQFFKWKTAK